ncbi:hypothetical protein H6P81_005386 [Aristolochia fimbriata]|uniref:Alpha-1,3-glucosyltransferase n=1 Tax=Aristolochia fimbriata TaxID=158543 RepID=A0AAV7EUF6_ARIFI|nr:hypothetical protein H6P81_005386 [Aristolochia fimbriata]
MTKKKKSKEDTAVTATSRVSAIKELAWFAGVATCIKLLLIPSYRSTDFEVHRNWLALTSSLPLSRWYQDETSPWTLDYPPLFAYFERFLAVFARLIDPVITDLHLGLDYSSNSVVVFQRLTVMVSDVVLFYGVYRLSKNLEASRRRILFALVVWSPALIIVDHIHFQYNGFLIGVLLVSLSFLEEGRDLLGGYAFAVLLCLKHLFAVAAPLYFVYLLKHYCRGGFWRGIWRFLVMGAAVGSVFAVSFGPFLYYGEMEHVLQRMFPFGRGLCHAYWAPNFWVFYIMFDKALAYMLGKLGFHIQTPAASFTSGLVGDSSPFSILPQVTPAITFVLVLLAILPGLVKAWRDPQPRQIVRLVAYAYTCGFLFGWHVHEKASLHFVTLLAIVATRSLEDAKHYFLISIVSCYSMFPLLFEDKEYPIKVLLLVNHSLLVWSSFSSLISKSKSDKEREKVKSRGLVDNTGKGLLGCVEIIYLLGILCIEIWGQFLHQYIFGDKLPFLPLMLISVYCALGMLYSWIWQLHWLMKNL